MKCKFGLVKLRSPNSARVLYITGANLSAQGGRSLAVRGMYVSPDEPETAKTVVL